MLTFLRITFVLALPILFCGGAAAQCNFTLTYKSPEGVSQPYALADVRDFAAPRMTWTG